jgi:hypothetical protein
LYSWGHSRRFNSYAEHIRKQFGGRIQKLAIDAGFSCPNRDGTKDTLGCTYCYNPAFNPSYCGQGKAVSLQIAEGITFHEKRYRRADRYLAYFQAFSNTHASLDLLETLYNEALSFPGVVGIVIGTRPDCIDDQKLELLKSLSKNHIVMVEYGIESVYNTTLKRVNRCHTFEDAVQSIKKTASAGIPVGGHLIFGLPGESRKEMLKSIEIISELPLTSVKFHQLQIFRDSPMARDFAQHPQDYLMPSLDEYLEFMMEFLEHLNPQIAVERIAGETPPRYTLIKPWGPRYDQILKAFENLLERKNSWQGKLYDHFPT